jgi:hypothetical protein
MEEYAAANGIHYDVVVRTRPDLYFACPVSQITDWSAIHVGPLGQWRHNPLIGDYKEFYNDQFAMGTPEIMKIYYDLHDNFGVYMKALKEPETSLSFRPESLMSWWFRTNNLRVNEIKMFYYLTRVNGKRNMYFLKLDHRPK